MTATRAPSLWMLLALIAAAYAGALGAGFIWDDHLLIEQNDVLAHPSFETILQRDLWCCTGGPASPYFRPVTTLSFLLDRLVGGGGPLVAHLQSLGWHLVVVALTVRWLRPALGNGALLAGLIVGLHPIQSEAVVWVAARNDLLAAAGVVGALVLLDGGRVDGGQMRQVPRLVGVALVGLCACLAKESAMLLPALGWLGRRAGGERLTRGEWLALGTGPALALLARLQVQWGQVSDGSGGHGHTLWLRLQVLAELLSWITLPWPLTSATTFLSLPLSAGVWLAAAVAVLGILVVIRRGAGWWLAWALLAFAPAAYGIDQYGLLGERYLYLPMVGVAAATATAARGARLTPLAIGVLAGLTLAALVALHVRLPDWRDDLTFFGSADARAPNSATRALHASAMESAGDADGAFRLYTESLAMSPMSPFACQHVAQLAEARLQAAETRAQLVGWARLGCRSTPPFYDHALHTLFRAGDLASVREILAGRGTHDASGRAARVEGALRLLDGDLLGAAATAGDRPMGAQRAAIWQLTRERAAAPAPPPTGKHTELAPSRSPL